MRSCDGPRDETGSFQLVILEWAPSSSERVNNKFLRLGRVCRMSNARKFRSDMSYQMAVSFTLPKRSKGRQTTTISMFLFSRNTPYSNRYVSTPLENNGNLHWQLIKVTHICWVRTSVV